MDSAVKNINVVCINFTQASVNPYGQPDRKKTVFYVKMLTLDSIGNSCDVLNSDLPGQ